MSELERLEKVAEDARKAVEAKDRELQALWSEYNALPAQIEAVEHRIEWCLDELKANTPDVIRANIREHYRALAKGQPFNNEGLLYLNAQLNTCDIYREVLAERQIELNNELASLRKRNKELAKKLGQR